MKQFFYLIAAIVIFTGCKEGFKKTKGSNYEMKLVGGGTGSKALVGQYMQLEFKNWIETGTADSVLQDTRATMPQLVMLDSSQKEVYNIYKQLRKGDSAVVRIIGDTMFKKMGREMPPFFRKGKYLYTSIKVLNIFLTEKEALEADKQAAQIAKPKIYKTQLDQIEKDLASKKADIDRDTRIIEEYLAKNNIKANRTTWGSYITFQNEGTGEKINPGSIVSVNYTGRTLDSGIVFDSNTDPKFGKVGQPYDVSMGQLGTVIVGWTDVLMQMKNGAKATVYIPSSLGYGTQGNGPIIKPGTNLIFDMEIKNVISEEQYAARQEAERKAFQEQQQRYMDSIQNAAKLDSLNKKK